VDRSTGSGQPLRAYAGVRTAGTTEGRVELLMSELERMGAFDRSVIIVQTPSGNGQIPPVNAAAPEFMFAGDVAQVTLQYAYVSSLAAMITERDAGDEASRQLVEAVTERVAQMPKDQRPRVFVAGESLGSLSTEAAFADLDDLVARVDGALVVGPTVMNPIRNALIDARDEGTPVWLPIVDQGSIARFAREPADLGTPTGPWGVKRVVYLQNSSDPVTWFDFGLLWSRPDFLDDPRGPDVSSDMIWIPVVTFWQMVLDLQFASGAPDGHGHRFGLNVVDGWAAVLQPEGWAADDTAKLRDVLARG
jgi:uncharacterized membrane protein